MLLQRVDFLFDVTTDPADRNSASSHSGGWSEGIWYPTANAPFLNGVQQIATARAQLSGSEVSIVGFRRSNFETVGNELIPLGTSAGKFLYMGLVNKPINLPQDALEISGTSSTSTNTNRLTLRGLPDYIIQNGESSALGADIPSVGWKSIRRMDTDHWEEP